MTNDVPESADYRLIVWREGERFYIHLPELAILVHDADLQAAYDKLEASRAAALKEYLDAGAPSLIPRPQQIRKARAVLRELVSSGGAHGGVAVGLLRQTAAFMVKAAAAGVVTVFVLVYGMNYAIQSFDRLLVEDLAGRAYQSVHRVAERLRNANPQARETLRQDLRTIAQELKPFIDGVTQPYEAAPAEKR